MFPFLISTLALSFLLFDQCQPIPMLKSPEEQQEKTPQFWSFFLQPGRFETTRPELAENLEAGQQNIQQGGKQKQQEEMNTSELGRREEPDYYEAVKAEEEEMERQKQNNGGGGKESTVNSTTETATGILNMMTALQVNVDPSPMLLIDGSAEGEKGGGEKQQKKMKPIVFPAKGRDQKKGEAEKIKTTMDGDTYDDERTEMGKADEEEGTAEGNGTSKMGEEQPADIVLLPEGRESLAGEMVGRKEAAIDGQTNGGSSENEEEEGGGEWPVVDGQTGDGKGAKGQEELAQPPRAKIFGKFA